MHPLQSMTDDKKKEALMELIKLMLGEEAKGNGEESVDVTQALHEAMESPEEEKEEHAGGLSEEEENLMEAPGEDLRETMAKFMKQSRKMPVKGKTKAVVLAAESGAPMAKKSTMAGKYK